jgi:hypothetical protein
MKIVHTSDIHLDSSLTARLSPGKIRERKAAEEPTLPTASGSLESPTIIISAAEYSCWSRLVAIRGRMKRRILGKSGPLVISILCPRGRGAAVVISQSSFASYIVRPFCRKSKTKREKSFSK